MRKRRGGYWGEHDYWPHPLTGGKPRKPQTPPMPPRKSGWNEVDARFRELLGNTPEKPRATEIPPTVSRIDPHRFNGLQLVPTATAEDDYIITIHAMRAGRIMRQVRAFGKEGWLWSMTGPTLVQAGMASSGETETLAEARVEFRRVFDDWLRWATAQTGTVYWHD